MPRSEASLCALQPLAPSFRVVLADAAGLRRLLDLSNCAPLTVGLLPGPPALHSLLSAGCLLCLETSPSGEASASALRFSWHLGTAGALTVILTAAASLREFFPLCLVLPLWGSATFLAFVPQLEALSESLTHSIPRSFLVVPLSSSAVGFADTLWLCPEHARRHFFASVSLFDPVALSPLLLTVSVIGARFALAEGRLPMRLVLSEPLVSCGGSTYIALRRTWLVSANLPCATEAQVGVSYFTARRSARIHGSHFVSFTDSCMSLTSRSHRVMSFGHLQDE